MAAFSSNFPQLFSAGLCRNLATSASPGHESQACFCFSSQEKPSTQIGSNILTDVQNVRMFAKFRCESSKFHQNITISQRQEGEEIRVPSFVDNGESLSAKFCSRRQRSVMFHFSEITGRNTLLHRRRRHIINRSHLSFAFTPECVNMCGVSGEITTFQASKVNDKLCVTWVNWERKSE